MRERPKAKVNARQKTKKQKKVGRFPGYQKKKKQLKKKRRRRRHHDDECDIRITLKAAAEEKKQTARPANERKRMPLDEILKTLL